MSGGSAPVRAQGILQAERERWSLVVPQREPDQEDILATALILSQSYGTKMTGMSAAMWVEEAIAFRRMVQAAGDVSYEPLTEVPA